MLDSETPRKGSDVKGAFDEAGPAVKDFVLVGRVGDRRHRRTRLGCRHYADGSASRPYRTASLMDDPLAALYS